MYIRISCQVGWWGDKIFDIHARHINYYPSLVCSTIFVPRFPHLSEEIATKSSECVSLANQIFCQVFQSIFDSKNRQPPNHTTGIVLWPLLRGRTNSPSQLFSPLNSIPKIIWRRTNVSALSRPVI